MLRKKNKTIIKKVAFFFEYINLKIDTPKRFERQYKCGEIGYLNQADYVIWRDAYLAMIKQSFLSNNGLKDIANLIHGFTDAKIRVVRKTEPDIEGQKKYPIVVLSVKNDLNRIKMVVEHYRKYGIKKFAILDNMSDDGTFEWLLSQPMDVDVYRVAEQYTTRGKEGWINRVISHYGFDKWYILTDSDELICYTNMEKFDFAKLVEYAENKKIKRFKALTLDMYRDKSRNQENQEQKGNIQDTYCWMDTDSYIETTKEIGKEKVEQWMIGGPRNRVLGAIPSLTKFPIVYFEPGTISVNAHFQFPYLMLREQSLCHLAILHYKFMNSDKNEYQRRIQYSSGFSAVSRTYYKKYLAAFDSNNNFIYAKSDK